MNWIKCLPTQMWQECLKLFINEINSFLDDI